MDQSQEETMIVLCVNMDVNLSVLAKRMQVQYLHGMKGSLRERLDVALYTLIAQTRGAYIKVAVLLRECFSPSLAICRLFCVCTIATNTIWLRIDKESALDSFLFWVWIPVGCEREREKGGKAVANFAAAPLVN